MNGKFRIDDLCRTVGRVGNETAGAVRTFLSKPATGAERVYPVQASCVYTLTTVVGPGDPFNRHPIVHWWIDEGRAEITVTTGPNDVEALAVSGGAPVSNTTRWDTITWWVSKSTTGNEWHIMQALDNGHLVGYGRMYGSLGNPITSVGRNGHAGPWNSPQSHSLEYEYEGLTIPSNANGYVWLFAVGVSTEAGELPPATPGRIIPKFGVLGTEVG